MNKTWFVTKGIMRLVITLLACMLLAALGYVAIIACVLLFPPSAIQ